MRGFFRRFGWLGFAVLLGVGARAAEVRTWDGKHSIEQIDVAVVYFVPKDRTPLPDWRERVDYFCRRIETFHGREFQDQSKLTTTIHPEPFVSKRSTGELRIGDANRIFFQTMNEVDRALAVEPAEDAVEPAEDRGFPILLVLSDINWRPLDDFYRLASDEGGDRRFEGVLDDGRHFPGAASGGSRATYLSDRGTGWGLVSADGWRVPYCGSDCVVYHEGVGHSVGLPHPDPANGSVMSLAQYRGWISQSWLDDAQKQRLGWEQRDAPEDDPRDLFSAFAAVPEPRVPKPLETVRLRLSLPEGAQLASCRVRVQTALFGPWVDVATEDDEPSQLVELGKFDRPTPVSYRVDATLDDGQEAELWGYFQVRDRPDAPPMPIGAGTEEEAAAASRTGRTAVGVKPSGDEVDLLALVEPERDAVNGQWRAEDDSLISPKAYGARIELPYAPPAEYRLVVGVEPLDEPRGLILGQRSGTNRFVTLIGFGDGSETPASAIENIDGQNVATGPTTVRRAVLERGRVSQVVVTVRKESVTVACDGSELIHWDGDPSRLSLSDYWETPNPESLFVGAYDCRYRFHRVTLVPLAGTGRPLGD